MTCWTTPWGTTKKSWLFISETLVLFIPLIVLLVNHQTDDKRIMCYCAVYNYTTAFYFFRRFVLQKVAWESQNLYFWGTISFRRLFGRKRGYFSRDERIVLSVKICIQYIKCSCCLIFFYFLVLTNKIIPSSTWEKLSRCIANDMVFVK